jgi:hypothetical protein
MGHPFNYWRELQERLEIEAPETEDLIQEIADLKGKVAFYESRIAACAVVMSRGK